VVSVLGRPATEYGLFSLLVSFALVVGNFVSARLVGHAERDRVILSGSVLALLGSGIGLALSLRGYWTPVAVFAPGVLLALGCGVSLPNAVAGAIGVDPEAAGSASGLSSFLQLVASAVFAQAVGTWQNGTSEPMSAYVTIAAAIALLSFMGLIRPRLALGY
jgi:MFS transporter, DHA1 family, multidrug resistance protein